MNFIELLKKESTPALGCTEPGAIALAAAKAAECMSKPVERIELYLSRNIMKNAMNVGIAGTEETGGAMAAALGVVRGKSKYGLECLKEISSEDIEKASQMIADKRVIIKLADTDQKVYVKVICYSSEEHSSVTISHNHDLITKIEENGRITYQHEEGYYEQETDEIEDFSLQEIYDFIQAVPIDEISFLREAISINKKVVQEGLTKKYGLSVGRKLVEKYRNDGKRGQLSDYVVGCTAAAVDARMAGVKMPVLSLNGSGNQGITATVPIYVLGKEWAISEEIILRALALSELVALYIKKYIGKLSALCACTVASSVGVSCGIVYMKGGSYQQMVSAINNMIADISGLICDGAKSTCALKIATGVNCAMQCAYLAMMGDDEIIGQEGIINEEIQLTIENLGRVATEGMTPTDKVILDIMTTQ